jgi:hypothetical protein
MEAATARAVWFAGVRVIVHVDAAGSDGRFGVWESEESQGVCLPFHVHEREDDATHRLAAGATLALPRGVPHAHLVTAPRARLLTVATPGGFERLFAELGVPAAPGTTAPARPDDATFAAAVRRLGVQIVGPPPFDR